MSERYPKNQELVNAARQGDMNAFEELVRIHTPYVYNFSYNLCGGNRAEADDLAQMTFIRAFRAMRRFEGRSEFKTWLHRITVNLWKNMVRSQKRRKYFQHQSIHEPISPDDDKPAIELAEKGMNPLERTEQQETSQLVRKAIDQLPVDERQVMILRDLEGYAYEEIAQLAHIPLGTVKSRLSRARRMLRETLDPVLRS